MCSAVCYSAVWKLFCLPTYLTRPGISIHAMFSVRLQRLPSRAPLTGSQVLHSTVGIPPTECYATCHTWLLEARMPFPASYRAIAQAPEKRPAARSQQVQSAHGSASDGRSDWIAHGNTAIGDYVLPGAAVRKEGSVPPRRPSKPGRRGDTPPSMAPRNVNNILSRAMCRL